jgi:hypothetical protein
LFTDFAAARSFISIVLGDTGAAVVVGAALMPCDPEDTLLDNDSIALITAIATTTTIMPNMNASL